MAINNNLNDFLTDIANAIRYKKTSPITTFEGFCTYSNAVSVFSDIPREVADTTSHGIKNCWNYAISNNHRYDTYLHYYKATHKTKSNYTIWSINIYPSNSEIYIDGDYVKTRDGSGFNTYGNAWSVSKENSTVYGPGGNSFSNAEIFWDTRYWSTTQYKFASNANYNYPYNFIVPISELVTGGDSSLISPYDFPTEILNL